MLFSQALSLRELLQMPSGHTGGPHLELLKPPEPAVLMVSSDGAGFTFMSNARNTTEFCRLWASSMISVRKTLSACVHNDTDQCACVVARSARSVPLSPSPSSAKFCRPAASVISPLSLRHQSYLCSSLMPFLHFCSAAGTKRRWPAQAHHPRARTEGERPEPARIDR
jgi:hypothetical protein